MYVPEMGERIRQLRCQRNLSQIELARQVGVSKSVISSYENNVHFPPYDVLLKIARLFDVSTDYLLNASRDQVINVDGLTDTQINAITAIVNELKGANRASKTAE